MATVNRLEDPRQVQFGEFVLDLTTGRLWRHGRAIRFERKPFQFLALLLERPGETVSREELQHQLWQGVNVNVEFDRALNTVAMKVRRALQDSSDKPVFIETISGKGYRFIASVVLAASELNDGPIPASPREVVLEHPSDSVVIGSADLAVAGPGGLEHLAIDREEARPSARRRFVVPAWLAVAAIGIVFLATRAALVRSQAEGLIVVRHQQLTDDRREKFVEGPTINDGTHVFLRHVSPTPPRWVPANGGEAADVAEHLRDLQIFDVHYRSGSYLAVLRSEQSRMRQLLAVSKAGARRNVGTITALSAGWSPDGERIAYTTETGIHVVRADGSQSKRIATIEGIPNWLRWSPDGETLRFTVDTVVDREPRAAIWEVRVDSTGLRRLPLGTTTSNECCGTWTPDGHFFVFQSRQPGRTDVWVIAEPRGVLQDPAPEPKQLTSGPLHFLAPGVSADGTRLFAVGRSDRGELVRFDAALRTFVPYLNGMSAVWIDFSRDEESVIYVRYPEDTLWRARADGSDARQLTFPPMQVDGCSWSPDGKRIAFRARTPGHASRVFIMSAEGGDAKPLIEEDREQGVPTWSRDGRHLAFGEVPAVYGQPGREAIQLYDLERRAFSKLPESTNLWSPRWSPDGRYIAAVALPGFRLRLFDVAKGSWRSFEADHVDHATWSKDSKYINYHTEGSVRSLRRVRISDGFVEEIASLDGYPIKAYWWSGLALDGSPLVVRDLVPPEIYALELERR